MISDNISLLGYKQTTNQIIIILLRHINNYILLITLNLLLYSYDNGRVVQTRKDWMDRVGLTIKVKLIN